MKTHIIPVPPSLKNDVEHIQIADYSGESPLSINVCLNGLPGLVFQQSHGVSPIDTIRTPSAVVESAPTLYLYGQMTEPSIMTHKSGSFTTIQVILKPHALYSCLGINAAHLTDSLVGLNEFFSSSSLNQQLLDASDHRTRVTLLTEFLHRQIRQDNARDPLIEQSITLIHRHIATITVSQLLKELNLSERHFERRFRQVIGVSPHFYIRIKRFNTALQWMNQGEFETLTDLAYALNFYDQSHFIRDMRAFSGLSPKRLAQRFGDLDQDQKIYSYL